MAIFTYSEHSLKKDGRNVHRLRVVGVAVEVALCLLAVHGMGSVAEGMLGETVAFSNLSVNGTVHDLAKVVLPRADAALALAIAVDMLTRLRKLGYALLPVLQYGKQTNGVCVPQRDENNVIIGAHDMLLDSLNGPRGRITAEVKLRSIHSEGHLERVRGWVRSDCNKVWKAAVKESPGEYGGQVLLLYTFPQTVSDGNVPWASRADFRSLSNVWSPMWGWRAAAQPVRTLPQSAPVRQQEPLPRVSVARKRPFDELELDWFEEGPRNDPKKMAAVAQMMTQAGKKDVGKVKRLIDEAKRDYRWPAGELKSTPKAASKKGRGGGKPGWAATERVLKDLHRTLRVP